MWQARGIIECTQSFGRELRMGRATEKRLGVLGITIFQRTLNRRNRRKRSGLSSCYFSSQWRSKTTWNARQSAAACYSGTQFDCRSRCSLNCWTLLVVFLSKRKMPEEWSFIFNNSHKSTVHYYHTHTLQRYSVPSVSTTVLQILWTCILIGPM